jgi:DNA repair exonuclease SbcCD ATPase subunit
MATDKKHIAVYLDSAIEQALIAFCERKGLKSKKGTMFSAGVNAALSEFFEISDTEESNTPKEADNTPQDVSNIPQDVSNIPFSSSDTPISTGDTILPNGSNIPSESLVVEVMQRKYPLSESEVESLRQELEEAKADRAKFLESSTYMINKYRQEVYEMTRSYVETKLADREQFEAELADREKQIEELRSELSELKQKSATAGKDLPDVAEILNQLKSKRKKSTTTLADVEKILEILGD